jgi:dextranase
LFDEKRQPIDFADGFLKIMNPCSPWQTHFVQECRRVLDALPFDGIHVDQYGEPKTGFDASGAVVDIPSGFAETLATLREAIGPDKVLLFNLVHNWPDKSIADSPLDFWYSELWPPETDFRRLWQTISNNRELNQRPAVIAVYISPEWENTVVAAQSTILAAGGTQIAHGDHGQYLSDPYFPKASNPSPGLAHRLQQLADFAVAYENALSFAEDVTTQWVHYIRLNDQPVEAGQVIVRHTGKILFVNLLNNAGQWNTELPLPKAVSGLRLTLPRDGLRHSWYSSPASPLPHVFDGCNLPPLSDWLLIGFEFEESIPCPT